MPVPSLPFIFTYASVAADMLGTTTASFSPNANDIAVVICVSEGAQAWTAPTSTGLTFTSRVSDNTASTCSTQLWTAPIAAGGARTVTFGACTSLSAWHSAVCFIVRDGTLAATPATVDTRGTGAPTATLTTVGVNSLLLWSNGDFAAVAPGTPAYRSGAVQKFLHDKTTANYAAYYAAQTAGPTGATTVGQTAPTGQTYKIVGVEVQGTAANTPIDNGALAASVQRPSLF